MYGFKEKEKINDPNKYLKYKNFEIFTCFDSSNLNFNKVNAKKFKYKLNRVGNNDRQDSFIPSHWYISISNLIRYKSLLAIITWIQAYQILLIIRIFIIKICTILSSIICIKLFVGIVYVFFTRFETCLKSKLSATSIYCESSKIILRF